VGPATDSGLAAGVQPVRLPDRSQPESGGSQWHTIEPILKWGAVAYGFGFLTVMVHTYLLGVPVLQLIEPVNVWIGAPLAGVVFFLDKLYLTLGSLHAR